MIQYSVVIPLHNEQDSIALLHDELRQAFSRLQADNQVEWILVDDGSRDGTWEKVREIVESDPRAKAIRFRRNFGKAAALTAGFAQARGAIVFTLDGDLQDDPIEIPRFLEKLSAGLDVVSGWKKRRHDPWHKVFPSRVFNWMVSKLTGCKLHDHNCGYKAYRAEVVREVRIYGELHRFVPVLAHARGFRVGEIEVNHRARRFGYSKYGFNRFIKGLLDLLTVRFLTGFSGRPLHVLGGIGLALMAIGVGGLGFLAIEWLFGIRPIGTRPFLSYSAIALGIGAQFFSLGILAELVTAYNLRTQDTYSVAETLESRPSTNANSNSNETANSDLVSSGLGSSLEAPLSIGNRFS